MRLLLLESEAEPLEAFEHGCVAVFALGGRVGPLVVAAEDGLAEVEWLGGLPGAVGRCGNHAAFQIGRPVGWRCRGHCHAAHRGADLGRARAVGRSQTHRNRAGRARLERQVEVEVGRVQPFRFDLPLRIVHRDVNGIDALQLRGVFDAHRERVERSGARCGEANAARGG